MMQLRNLFKTFNPGTPIENPALRGINLDIAAGEFVTVIGSNGSGKSTMLNAISGDLLVDRGAIIIDGKDVTRLSAWQRAGAVARVFQDPMIGTCEALSIEENLALSLQRGQRRSLKRAVREELHELFRSNLAHLNLGLENRLSDRMGLLSGGQRQAVSLLMASLQPSRMLLLDEHTAALDPKTAEIVMQLTNKVVQEKHLTTLMVTHNLRHAVEYGDRLLMMHQGHVIMDKAGDEKRALKVDDLLDVFTSISIECGN